jgi:hypothetical protein
MLYVFHAEKPSTEVLQKSEWHLYQDISWNTDQGELSNSLHYPNSAHGIPIHHFVSEKARGATYNLHQRNETLCRCYSTLSLERDR